MNLRSMLFGIMAAGLFAACSPAASSQANPSEGAQSPDVAMRELQAASPWLESELAAGRPPRLSDPDAEAKIRAAFNVNAMPAIGADVASAENVCARASSLQNAYIYWRTDPTDIEAASENLIKYQDEVALTMRFALACQAYALPMLTTFVEGLKDSEINDARRQGLVKMRKGIVHIYMGVIMMQADPLKPSNKKLLLEQAARDAKVFSSVMTIADRQSVITTLDQIGGSNTLPGSTIQTLMKIRTEMADTNCVGLCRF